MTQLGKIMLAIALIILGAGSYWLFSSKPFQKPTVLKVGFIGPLSVGTGELGAPILDSIQLAADELKAEGVKIEIFKADDNCDPAKASLALQKLADVDQVKFIIGGVCNDEALTLAKAAEAARVVLMIPTVATSDIATAGDFIFRNTQVDALGGKQLGAEAAKTVKKMVVFSEPTSEAVSYRNAFIDAFVAGGGVVVDDEEAAPGVTDVYRSISRMRRISPKAEAIFINLRNDRSVTAALDEMIKQGWSPKIFGYPNLAGKAELPKYKKLLSGMMFAEAPHLDPKNPLVEPFLKAFTEKYDEMSGVDVYNAGGYEAVKLFALGFSSGAYTSEAMRDYLYGVKAYVGIQGTYEFDANGEMQGVPFILKTVK